MLYVWKVCISNSRNLSTRDLLAQELRIWSSLWQVDNCTSIKQTLYRMNDSLWISLNCASGYLSLPSAVSRRVIEPYVFCNSVFLITLSVTHLYVLPANSPVPSDSSVSFIPRVTCTGHPFVFSRPDSVFLCSVLPPVDVQFSQHKMNVTYF